MRKVKPAKPKTITGFKVSWGSGSGYSSMTFGATENEKATKLYGFYARMPHTANTAQIETIYAPAV